MTAWGKITKWISGRALSDKNEKRRLERQYEDVAQALKLVTEVAHEPPVEYRHEPLVSYSCAIAALAELKSRKPFEGSLCSFTRPDYERSASSPAVPTTTRPANPDITASDHTQAELKGTQSCDTFWDVNKQPLPPMPKMTGFGRYRRAVDAPTEWKMDQVRRSLQVISGMDQLVVNHLGDCPPAGLDAETWREYRAHHSRANSVTSSRSSGSDPVTDSAIEYTDANTGTRVCRGFSSSTTSSAASSFKENSVHYRRDSSFSRASTTSHSSDGDAGRSRRTSRSSLSGLPSAMSLGLLTSISETQETAPPLPRKIEKPCEFDENESSENALASDDDDDELDWADMLEVGGENTSNLTKRLERTTPQAMQNGMAPLARQRTHSSDRQKARSAQRTLSDRSEPSKTIKVASRPGLGQRRLQYHKKQADLHEIGAQQNQMSQPPANAQEDLKYSETETGTQTIPIPQPRGTNNTGRNTIARMALVQEAMSEDVSATPSPDQLAEDGIVSCRSDTSADTLFAGDTQPSNQPTVASRRRRSNTVRRVRLISPSFKYSATKLRDMVEE